MIRTIFLDAAGTLIEPAEPVAAVYRRHFSAAGWEVEEAAVKSAFGKAFASTRGPDYAGWTDGETAERRWWREVVAETSRQCGFDPASAGFDTLFLSLFSHYDQGAAWRVYPEARGCLEILRAAGHRLAVVSNFDLRLHRILEETGLAGFFEAIITSAEARARKPDRAIFDFALERMGVRNALHIGDSALADGVGAAQAGLQAFILNRPSTTLAEALHWIGLQKGPK